MMFRPAEKALLALTARHWYTHLQTHFVRLIHGQQRLLEGYLKLKLPHKHRSLDPQMLHFTFICLLFGDSHTHTHARTHTLTHNNSSR